MNIRMLPNRRTTALIAGTLMAGTLLSPAAEHTYRYFRFSPIANRGGNAGIMQLSEWQFFDSSGGAIPTAGVTVTADNADTPGGEAPPNAFDGDLSNKWLDFNFTDTNLIFDFGSAVTIDAYNYITGNDGPERDPVAWRIEGSDDPLLGWTTLDDVEGFLPSSSRNGPASPTNFILPAELPPKILFFEPYDFPGQSGLVVANGDVGFYADTEDATELTLSVNGGPPTPAVNFSENLLTLPDEADSIVTLTATNSGGVVMESLFVRTITPTTRDVRYVRFTPVSLRDGGTIQISDFKFFDDADQEIPVIDATDPGGSNTPGAGEGVLRLIDGNAGTKWLSTVLSPITFDLGATTTVATYEMVTGNDFPDRDPAQWILEGSTDGTDFFYIDTMVGADFPLPTARNVPTQRFPLPADGSMPPIVDFSLSSLSIGAGEDLTLDWDVALATSVEIQPRPGSVADSGTTTLNDVAEDTTFTLTAVAALGRVVEQSYTVLVAPPFAGTFDYPDFDNAAGINPVGTTRFVNVFPTFPADPDARRLRLTSTAGGQQGSAWYYDAIDLSGGFETTFDAQFTHPSNINGADGMSFIIQNSAAGNAAGPFGAPYPPTPAQGGDSASNSLAISLDSYLNTGEPSNAFADVFVNGVSISRANLASAGLGIAKGSAGNYLSTGVGGGNAYEITIRYVPGDLDVLIDGIVVFDSLDVDLGTGGANPVDVLDASGEAFVGFTARTGGLSENHDILNWFLTTELAGPTNPLAITDFDFDFSTVPATLSLTWISEAGTTYKVTRSSTLSGWTDLATDILGQAGTTSTTVEIPDLTGDHFRIEEVEPAQ